MPTPKYKAASADPVDGCPIYWNVHPDGVPVRHGDSPVLIDQHQLDAAGITLSFQSEVLEIPKQLPRYAEVWDWIANGLATLKSEELLPVPDRPGCWYVWLSWVNVRGYIPAKPRFPAAASGVL